ncbi:sigma-54-dependent transcriptional regulator family protein [Mycolicibacterium fluoranthenivorans]|uniref:transcriptional regulator n=1 Tax=Mycolicibacterium fluoranthenivorans TaxID=258505 RepID=UPI0038B2A3F1
MADKTRSVKPSPEATADSARPVHELIVAGQKPLRRFVAESWQRSLAIGVDPDRGAREAAAAARLSELRNGHPLAVALPVIRKLLVDYAVDSGVVVAVTAADGTMLWVEGDAEACRKVAAMNFVPGADWSEQGAGTNAPGTALALDREVQIDGHEHFSRLVRPWTCTAVPVHDPVTGLPIGSIDLTGGSSIGSAQTLALVRATAVAVEHRLALSYSQTPAVPADSVGRLTVLGADRPSWHTVDERGRTRSQQLSGRHAEILVLLLQHSEGLSSDHLAVLLDERELDAVTIRAELSRLRRIVGTDTIGSRPYRLLAPMDSDMGEVFAALRRGDIDAALDNYTGLLLPRSGSPAVARLRTELSSSLRGAVLAASSAGDSRALRRWLDLPEARDDRHGWQTLHDHHGADELTRAHIRGHLTALDTALS